MPKQTDKTGKLKISELAKRSGIPVPTIKYYIREGLIPRPKRDGRKTSNYDPEYVDRLILIKTLQKERFLPLKVIRKLISTEALTNPPLEMALGSPDTPDQPSMKNRSLEDLPYPSDKISAIESAGLIHAQDTSEGKGFGPIDSQIIGLIKQREDAGIPFDYTLNVMGIYQKHFCKAVEEDNRAFFKYMMAHPDEEDLFKYITEGEKTAATYFKLVHTKLSRQNMEKILKSHDMTALHIVESLNFRRAGRSESLPEAPAQLWVMIQNTLQTGTGNITDAGQDPPSTGRMRQLIVEGILDLREGNTDEALKAFCAIPSTSDIFSLAMALAGLTGIMKTSRSSGLAVFIRDLKIAVPYFEMSEKSSPDPVTALMTSYFRLAGFAVGPDVFDMQEETLKEYEKLVAGQRELAMDKPDMDKKYEDKRALKWFIGELVIKASYFLALMYQSRNEPEKAAPLLDRIIRLDGDPFYTGWALKKKKDQYPFPVDSPH